MRNLHIPFALLVVHALCLSMLHSWAHATDAPNAAAGAVPAVQTDVPSPAHESDSQETAALASTAISAADTESPILECPPDYTSATDRGLP
eukprot:SAG31_NODE_15983_length_728_cov_1.338633_1_plen_90_part_01